MKLECKTQWHVIVAELWRTREWTPTHQLQSHETDFGFIGSSGEQRVRELARNAPCIPAELRGKVEKKRGSAIGLDPRYEYFRYAPQLTDKQVAALRVRLFDAGAPAEQIFAL